MLPVCFQKNNKLPVLLLGLLENSLSNDVWNVTAVLCFLQVVDCFNNIPLSEHHFIIKGHKPVLYVSLNSMYELDSIIKQLWRKYIESYRIAII